MVKQIAGPRPRRASSGRPANAMIGASPAQDTKFGSSTTYTIGGSGLSRLLA